MSLDHVFSPGLAPYAAAYPALRDFLVLYDIGNLVVIAAFGSFDFNADGTIAIHSQERVNIEQFILG